MDNKDLVLKVMCKLLYNKMGYSTHYEIKLRTKSYVNVYKTHDVSDIDVFGYHINSDLSFFRIGSECKSGETNALDELYKFLGVKNYYKLDKGYLLKSKIHQNARQVSLTNGIICLTEAELRRILLGCEFADVDKAISIEMAKYSRLNKSLNGFKKKNEKLIDYVSLDYWNKDTWRNVHNLIHRLKLPQSQFEFSGYSVGDILVIYYIVELFALAVLSIATEAISLNYSDFESAFVNSLYGGAEALNEKRRIHDEFNMVLQQSNEFAPAWQSDLVSIVSRFSQYPFAASKICQLIQETYENSFYDAAVKIDTQIVAKYPDLTRKFVQDLMQFLVKYCELPENVFSNFMSV